MLTDEQILDPTFRAKVIKEIEGVENVNRKKQQKAMLEIYRDQIVPFVLQRLKDQGFAAETLAVMNQRATSINIYKKIVSKKARSYSKGCSRSIAENEAQSEDLEIICESMNLTGAMKKADRYRKAARNAILYIIPEKFEDPAQPGKLVMKISAKVYFPHLYDVIPDAENREKMRCLILSPFSEPASAATLPNVGGGDGRGLTNFSSPIFRADNVDQTIANSPGDAGAGKREYIWWTAKYHLTTDEQGVEINGPGKTPEGAVNPIGRIPAVNLPEEQDGEFWALGGDDLKEATILLNVKLTDMESILHMQGWGQLVIEGEDVEKKDFAVGPQKAMILSTAKGATHKLEAKILQHDPQTDAHMKSAEMHVALCLTTNNLSVKSVAANLQAGSYASAIAKMVDEAENLDDISDDQGFYSGKEKEAVLVAQAWLDQLRGTNELWPVLKSTKAIDVSKMTTQFHNQEQVISEQERLTNLKIRKELGIDSVVDLIRKDNPALSEKQAMAKALKVMNENAELAAKARAAGIEPEKKPGEENPPKGPEDEVDPTEGEEDEETT